MSATTEEKLTKKYYYDTEFIEGTQQGTFLGFKVGKEIPTIDLISIAVVCDDGRMFNEVSKDFNLDKAWESEFVREKVLRSIWKPLGHNAGEFNKKNFRILLSTIGKTNKEIAYELLRFFKDPGQEVNKEINYNGQKISYRDYLYNKNPNFTIELYNYYGAYDHVVLCWLYGRMVDLPVGLPKFSYDLKQMYNNKIKELGWRKIYRLTPSKTKKKKFSFSQKNTIVKKNFAYPTNKGEHIAVFDALWNKQLHDFITEKL